MKLSVKANRPLQGFWACYSACQDTVDFAEGAGIDPVTALRMDKAAYSYRGLLSPEHSAMINHFIKALEGGKND